MIKAKELKCPNCKHKESLESLNIREDSKMFFCDLKLKYDINREIVKNYRRDLDIYTLMCFACNHITNFAADPTNQSGKAIDGVEYFETFKYDSIEEFPDYSGKVARSFFYALVNMVDALDFKFPVAKSKFDKIKI